MRWQVEVPGGAKVFLADLSLEVIGDCAREYDTSWAAVMANPLVVDDRVVLSIYRACCAHADVEPPESPSAGQVWDAFDLVKDDLPTAFEDGNPKGAAGKKTA